MADLKTNYVDDVLDSSKNQLRKYQQIQNDDGTVSFVDVTEYSTTGTSFGAKDINDTNAAVNELNNSLDSLNSKLSQKQTLLEIGSFKGNINNVIEGSLRYGTAWCRSTECSGTQPISPNDDVFYFLTTNVSGQGQCYQICLPYDYSYKIAVRLYVNNSWTDWSEV